MDPRTQLQCFEYALLVLLGEDFQNHHPAAQILYQEPEVNASEGLTLCIVPSGFFGDQYGRPGSLPVLPLREIDGVPLLFGSPRIQRKGNRLVVHADIIASTYFLVTRYEEVVRRDVRDNHGRFPGRESLPYRAGFIERPIVEEYGDLLRGWLRAVGIRATRPDRQFSVLRTHDVDHVRMYRRYLGTPRTMLSAILGRQPWRNVSENLAVAVGTRNDPFDTFTKVAALDKSLDKGSADMTDAPVYFFMAGGKGKYDGSYSIYDHCARTAINTVVDAGATIGLHASYAAGICADLIATEKKRLEEVCGFPINRNRHHFLAWREVEDGWALGKAGINWDATLGYADVAGFRLGVCHPIPIFDPIRMEAQGIEEHPLIVMDKTLSDERYMGLGPDEAIRYSRRLLDQTRRYNGEFVVLWHTETFGLATESWLSAVYASMCNG